MNIEMVRERGLAHVPRARESASGGIASRVTSPCELPRQFSPPRVEVQVFYDKPK
jgi:hypothetical protein